jgi:hypothetical protein
MPVQGVESPYPESTARVISEFCDARSNFSLADAAQHDRTIESSEELRFVTANRATDADIFSIHVRSMKPRACRRKFRILSAVQSESVACKSVGVFFDGFVNSGRQSVIDAVVKKVGEKRITNSKDLRKLRAILPDPVAREHFPKDEGDLESAALRLAPAKKEKRGLSGELDSAVEAMKRVPWTTLAEMKGDADILRRQIDEAEALLKSLRKTLFS